MKTHHAEKKSSGSMAKDPVCGMDVDIRNPGAKLSAQGQDQYFCSAECRDKFQSRQGEQSASIEGEGRKHGRSRH